MACRPLPCAPRSATSTLPAGDAGAARRSRPRASSGSGATSTPTGPSPTTSWWSRSTRPWSSSSARPTSSTAGGCRASAASSTRSPDQPTRPGSRPTRRASTTAPPTRSPAPPTRRCGPGPGRQRAGVPGLARAAGRRHPGGPGLRPGADRARSVRHRGRSGRGRRRRRASSERRPATSPAAPELVTDGVPSRRPRWLELATSSDHKDVGRMLIGAALSFLVLGPGRVPADPRCSWSSPRTPDRAGHLQPAALGDGRRRWWCCSRCRWRSGLYTYVVPLQIGARRSPSRGSPTSPSGCTWSAARSST